VVSFGEENEYSCSQFSAYKEEAEKIIKSFLTEEYYTSGGSQIGHDYSLFFLADEMTCFELIQASSNWSFQEGNDARFKIVHLNNYDKAFNDFSDFVSESRYTDIRSLFSNQESEIVDYLKENASFDEDDFFNNEEDPNPLDDIKTLYKSLSFEEKLEMWDSLDDEQVVEEFNKTARAEAIDSIIEAINWDEIESYFNEQFCQES
jgi:hypothetical protein